jgi:hypothetical protein
MSYFDFTDDIIEIDQTNGIIPTGMQQLPATTTTTPAVVSQQQQQPKDLSDWRNIQLGTTSTIFDPFWLPQTPVTPWTASNQTVYPSYYPWANRNDNQPWRMPAYPIGTTQSFVNFNHPDTMNLPTNPPNPMGFDKY